MKSKHDMLSYHHWDEEQEVEWDWYAVMHFGDEGASATWPIFSFSYEAAMDIYQILLKDYYNRID